MSGWGFDVDGNPVPRGERGDSFNANFSRNRSGWKTGPVDLRWDEDRQVWAGGHQIVEGYLTTKVTPARKQGEVTIPIGEATVKVARVKGGKLRIGADNGEIKVKNLDKHLKISDEHLPLYCSCIRINGEWRFLYIGCDVPPDEDEENEDNN